MNYLSKKFKAVAFAVLSRVFGFGVCLLVAALAPVLAVVAAVACLINPKLIFGEFLNEKFNLYGKN